MPVGKKAIWPAITSFRFDDDAQKLRLSAGHAKRRSQSKRQDLFSITQHMQFSNDERENRAILRTGGVGGIVSCRFFSRTTPAGLVEDQDD